MALTGVAVSMAGPCGQVEDGERTRLTRRARTTAAPRPSPWTTNVWLAKAIVTCGPRLMGGYGLRAATSAARQLNLIRSCRTASALELGCSPIRNIGETFGSEWRQHAALFRPSVH